MNVTKQQLLIITSIVFIGFIGVAMPFPIFAPLFLHPAQGNIIPYYWNHSLRGIMLGIVLAAYPFGQFIGSPILGSFSDHYGRKKILLLCLFGTTIGYLVTAYSIFQNEIVLLIISRFITGILEGNVAIARAVAAELPDVNKYRGFGMIGFATTMGYIIGPIVGGVLADKNIVVWFNFTLPFCFAAPLSFLAFIISYFYLAETIHFIKKQQENLLGKFNILNKFKRIRENKLLLDALLAMFLLSLSVDIYYEFFPAYLVGQWQITSAKIALFTLSLAIAVAIGDVFLVPIMSRFKNDIRTIKYFSLLLAISMVVIVFCTRLYYLFFIFFIIGLAIAVTTTTIVIYISNLSKKDLQGETMGLALSLRTLGDGFICLAGGLLIAVSYKLPIILSALFAVTSILLLMKLNKSQIKKCSAKPFQNS